MFWKRNVKTCTSFEEQKGTRYIWGNNYFETIIFSCLPLVYEPMSQTSY